MNGIGVDSPFHLTHGHYADPVDDGPVTLPKGWKGHLVNLPAGTTGEVAGLCLEPHDLAIARHVARGEKDKVFPRELVRRGLLDRERLRALVEVTPVTSAEKDRIRADIAGDFA